MKKFLFILIVISSMVFSLFAQSSQVRAANKKTAERCLKLSESNILAGDWQNDFHFLLIFDNLSQNGGCHTDIENLYVFLQ